MVWRMPVTRAARRWGTARPGQDLGDALRRPAYRETKVRTLVKTVAEVTGPSAAVDLSPPLRFAIRPAALPVDVFYSPGHPIT
jgi:hypothetical protein